MSTWSSSPKTVAGEIRNGGAVQSHFLAMGKIWVADHFFIYEEGQLYGWSDPLTGDFSGVRNHRLFRVENVSPSLTRFIQSDDFTGAAAVQHGATLARVGFENYPIFNNELRDEVLQGLILWSATRDYENRRAFTARLGPNFKASIVRQNNSQAFSWDFCSVITLMNRTRNEVVSFAIESLLGFSAGHKDK